MDSAEMELFQENVEEFVMDENKIVTFKYLASTLQISIACAKRILRDYVFPGGKRRPEVHITYVLGGQLLDQQGYKISLVREDDVAEVEKRFSSVDLKEIFCVHKVDSVHDLNVIYGIDSNLHNVKPLVTCTNAVQRAPRVRTVPTVSVPKPPVKPALAPAKKEAAQEPEVTTAKTGFASIFGGAATKKPATVNTNAAKQKKGGGITSFFAKCDKVVTESKPQDSVKVESKENEPIKDVKSENSKDTMSDPPKKATATSSSKENSPKNASPVRSAKPAKQKKARASKEAVPKQRRRIVVASDSDSDESAHDVDSDRCPSPDAPPPDFRAESSDDDVVPATPVAGTARKRVLKVKTTIDDEGYVVTTKEWQWEGEEDQGGSDAKESAKNEEETALTPKALASEVKCPAKDEETEGDTAKNSIKGRKVKSDDGKEEKEEEKAKKSKKGKKVESEDEDEDKPKKRKKGKQVESEGEEVEIEKEKLKKQKKGKKVDEEDEEVEIEKENSKKQKKGKKVESESEEVEIEKEKPKKQKKGKKIESESEEEEIEKEKPKKQKKGTTVESASEDVDIEEEVLPKKHKKGEKVNGKEKVEAKAKKEPAKKERKVQAKKKEENTLDKSHSQGNSKSGGRKSTEASKETKKGGSKRKLEEVDDDTEDDSKEKAEKGAKKPPAKKPAPKKPKSPVKGQTNIMSFFGKK